MKPDLAALLHAAEQALEHAHAPYSRLRVGAAVRSASGSVYAGCNVENAAFPLGSCAEANAIAAAVLAEGPGLDITDVAIAAHDAAGKPVNIPPCGGCRQRILEFGAAIRVHWSGPQGEFLSLSVAELLPASFRLEPSE